jgi:hypothetical protein
MTKSMKRKTGTSSKGKKSAKKSTPNSAYDHDEVVSGLRVELKRALLSKKSVSVLVPEDQLDALKKEEVICVSDPTPDELPPPEEYPAAPLRGDDEDDVSFAAKMKSWEDGKATWEETQANKPPLKKVTLWAPIYHVIAARVDGVPLKVFHTHRGPIVGLVVGETSKTVTLYSPAFIDPNVQSGRVHYFPIAFAGYQYTLYRDGCLGESVPDQPVCLGYPAFVKQNQGGDYVFCSKSAYHVIDADIDVDAETVSVDAGVRAHLEGALVTSDTKQTKEIEQTRRLREMTKA